MTDGEADRLGVAMRRRAPAWVRNLSVRQLHSLTGRLQREFEEVGLSSRQDWLLGSCYSELEYRRRLMIRRGLTLQACSCAFCVPVEYFGDYEAGPVLD